MLTNLLVYNMLNWGVTKEMALTFAYEMAGRNNIPKPDVKHVEVFFYYFYIFKNIFYVLTNTRM